MKAQEYNEGFQSCLEGNPKEDCPYRDNNQPDRTQLWEAGWDEAEKHIYNEEQRCLEWLQAMNQ